MLILANEFCDGNVPASRDIARLVDETYEMLPPGPWRVKAILVLSDDHDGL